MFTSTTYSRNIGLFTQRALPSSTRTLKFRNIQRIGTTTQTLAAPLSRYEALLNSTTFPRLLNNYSAVSKRETISNSSSIFMDIETPATAFMPARKIKIHADSLDGLMQEARSKLGYLPRKEADRILSNVHRNAYLNRVKLAEKTANVKQNAEQKKSSLQALEEIAKDKLLSDKDLKVAGNVNIVTAIETKSGDCKGQQFAFSATNLSELKAEIEKHLKAHNVKSEEITQLLAMVEDGVNTKPTK